ncbi:MAG: hypothetical protein AAGF92_17725 [Myxococcota bacterium]
MLAILVLLAGCAEKRDQSECADCRKHVLETRYEDAIKARGKAWSLCGKVVPCAAFQTCKDLYNHFDEQAEHAQVRLAELYPNSVAQEPDPDWPPLIESKAIAWRLRAQECDTDTQQSEAAE